MKIPARAESLADRAVSTAAQSVAAYVGTAAVADALSLDWRVIGGVALGGAFSSLVSNLARGGITGRITPPANPPAPAPTPRPDNPFGEGH